MSNDPQVQQLLDELFDTQRSRKRSASPAPTCFRRFARPWRQICLVEADLDVMFPPPRRSPAKVRQRLRERARPFRISRAISWKPFSVAAAWELSSAPGMCVSIASSR